LEGFVVVLHDVTDRAERERALADARAQAEDANRAKSSFLAGMSHELRTPLNAVIGFAEIIRDEMLGPVGQARYRGYADDIATAGQHLLALINDVLDLSKVEAGKLAVAAEAIEPGPLVEACLRLVAGPAAERIDVALPPRGCTIHGDARLVRQMIVNLLSNALKFTPAPGRVRLAIDAVPEGIEISVADDGVGMTPDEVAVALSPYGQVDGALARAQVGTGLGLPIVKALVEAHRGRFAIASTPGLGTTVRLLLPGGA
jgi:two-component system cell cycle sensor histidine kinase PleC